MKITEIIMGMTAIIEIVDDNAKGQDIDDVLKYFRQVDEQFSTYKKTSEITKINKGILIEKNASSEMKKVFHLAEETRRATKGFFNIHFEGIIDPSGIVKGYAINEASKMLQKRDYKNFYIGIGGDIDIRGTKNGQKWKVGIQSPFNTQEIIKVVYLSNNGIATSGTYIRGSHIYDPVHKKKAMGIASVTVIGPDIYEADRFATATFAMGKKGIEFLESLEGFEGYMVTNDKIAIQTSGFHNFL